MVELLKTRNEWCTLLKDMDTFDFYHTFDYHCLDKNKGERPVLVKYANQISTIAIPLLIRKIENTSFLDATSVMGYSGPITKNVDKDFDNSDFKKELQHVLKKNSIISVFSRLNPFILNQDICLENIGETVELGKIVNIDLTKPLDEQRADYQKRLKTYINKSRRLCNAQIENTPQGLMEFMNIYEETMLRLKAAPKYFFPRSYFEGLLKSTAFETEIWLVRENVNGKAIAGAVFIKKNKSVHYHLSGARAGYRHMNGIKLIIDEMRIRSTQQGYTKINLGGGVGGREDSLFRFKNSFSKDVRPFRAWKYIVDSEVYNDLVAQREGNSNFFMHADCQNYFPQYRCDPYFDPHYGDEVQATINGKNKQNFSSLKSLKKEDLLADACN